MGGAHQEGLSYEAVPEPVEAGLRARGGAPGLTCPERLSPMTGAAQRGPLGCPWSLIHG